MTAAANRRCSRRLTHEPCRLLALDDTVEPGRAVRTRRVVRDRAEYAGLDTGPFDFSARAFAAAAASPWLWLAVGSYLGEFLGWIVILRHSSPSKAFPTGAIVLIMPMIASRCLFDEPMGWMKPVGSAMIVAGVLLPGPDHPAAMPAATGHDED